MLSCRAPDCTATLHAELARSAGLVRRFMPLPLKAISHALSMDAYPPEASKSSYPMA